MPEEMFGSLSTDRYVEEDMINIILFYDSFNIEHENVISFLVQITSIDKRHHRQQSSGRNSSVYFLEIETPSSPDACLR